MQVAVVIPSEFQPGRFLLCRRNQWGWTTVVEDHPTEATAEQARKRLQAEFDRAVTAVDPNQPRQMVLGFYGPEHGGA